MRTFVANFSPFSNWINAGSITAASTTLTVTGRDVATADAMGSTKVVVLKLADTRPKALLFRFRFDGSNDGSNVLDLFVARGNDDYYRVATLTVLQGQQLDSGSIYFGDTIAPSNEDTLFDGEEGATLTDQICHYYVRTLGFDRFLFQVTTLAATTVYVDYATLYE